MIGVAFEAARLRVVWARRMALLAGCDSGNQNVRRFCAGQSILMTPRAGKPSVRIVIESRVRQPLQSDICLRYFRQRTRWQTVYFVRIGRTDTRTLLRIRCFPSRDFHVLQDGT